jgi:hypothetical protein
MLILSTGMGVVYCVMHLLNGWALRAIEFSDHISLVYLPGFIRLANVLLLGLFWGSLSTAIGGVLLLHWSNDSLFLSLCNITTSAMSPVVAVLLMRAMQHRYVALSRLSDLIQLALLYALLNALLHHLMWSWLDPRQLMSPEQLFYMVAGDINGVILGGLFLRWLARKTDLTRKLLTRKDDLR